MKEIIVFGHQNPDTDSIASAIACASYLNAKGVDAEAVALGEPSEETSFALDRFSFEAPRLIEKAEGEGEKVFLVDHNEFQQSVADIKDVKIAGVVDHHKIGNFETADPVFYRAEPLGSTCSILYKMFKEDGIEIAEDVAGIMFSAIASDTLLFKSPTCTEEDKEIAKDLAKIAGLEDYEEYGAQMLEAGTNLDGKSAEEILEGDAKTYDINGYSFRIGQVNVVDVDNLLNRKNELLEAMEDLIADKGYSNFILVMTDILESNSVALVRGPQEEELAEIFGQDLEDNQFDLKGVVSRKKQVVPPITERFS